MRKFLLFISDLVLLYFSLGLILILRYRQTWDYQLDFHLLPFSLIFALWLFVYYIANFYETSFLKNDLLFYNAFFKTNAFNAILATVFFYLLPYWGIAPRRNLFFFIVVFAAADFFIRLMFNHLFASAKFKKPALIVGIDEQSLALAQFLEDNPQWGYQLETLFSPQAAPEINTKTDIITDREQLRQRVAEKHITNIIISSEAYKIPRLIELFYQLLPHKINFYTLADFYEKISHKVPLAHIDQAWFLENLSEGTKKLYEISKRVFDLIFSVIFGLPALFLTPFIALAIKWESAGPVFFRQTRVGQLGRSFQIIKFRTMIANAEKSLGAVWAQENDPRVTTLGRFLRRTRLDELPQLWNIFKGEMSFVGPRAERPEFHDQLKKAIPFYEERYLIKPGLTGWAQVQYRYGASIKDAAEKLQYDLYYIKHRSLALDFSVILKTINIVIQQAGR